MSRQIRMQIPQKQKKERSENTEKKKRVDRNACLLVFILIFSGILTFLLLTARDNNKLNSTLDETFDFVKNRIESYEIYNTNDQVKNLVRLLHKTTELSRVIEQEGNLSTEMLDEYAREQRLTGILVLDQNLEVTEQSAKDGDTMSLWQKLIKSDYVRDIAEHPEKTYTTRLRNKGKIYDFAAVARQDAAGILITYAQKEEVNELNGDLTMASLFSDFPFEMNGSVVICDDDKVVSTNRQELTARSIEEAKSQYKNKFEADENGIVHLRSETGNWFGRREKIKDYDAYIFFPESQVYITRNIICVIYVLLALLLFLLYRVNRSRTEKRSILQDQKRLRVINALGHAYASISLVNLKTEEIEILKSSGNMKPDQKGDMLFKAHQEELIRQVIAEPFQKAYWEFVDISTVVFSVKDDGIGMSPEFREQVFDSFTREHTVTENGIGGTGLGMAITKNIVDMLGGTIHVESEVGRGTEFTVMLECEISEMTVKEEPDPEQREPLKNEKQKIRAEIQRRYEGKKVLLVEDNELNREIATAIMEEIGLNVDCVEDGTDAVNIMSSAEGGKYDLIFMDIQMPKMDGYTATREIRTLNDPKCANIPIIAMTANAFEEDRKKAIKAGMNAHIAKPISVDIILENLERMHQNRKYFNEPAEKS